MIFKNQYAPSRLFLNPSKTILLVMFFSLITLLTPLATEAILAQDGSTVHTVVQGDTLSAIAKRYGVSLATLQTYNQIANANLIRPGDRIVIPSVAQPQPTPKPPLESREGKGEAEPLQGQTNGTTADPISAPPAVGNVVSMLVPTATSRPAPIHTGGLSRTGERLYTVRLGDTLYGLSARFGVSVQAIMERNQLTSTMLRVSWRLIIPLPNTSPSTTHLPSVHGSNTSPPATPTPTPKSQFIPRATPALQPTVQGQWPNILPSPTPTLQASPR